MNLGKGKKWRLMPDNGCWKLDAGKKDSKKKDRLYSLTARMFTFAIASAGNPPTPAASADETGNLK